MRLVFLLATAAASFPECSEIPNGQFRTMLHPDRYLEVEANRVGYENVLSMTILGKPAPEDPYDYDDEVKMEEFSPLMHETISYELLRDCRLVLDEENLQKLGNVVRGIHGVTKNYIEGRLTYDLKDGSLMLDGWFPIVRVN